MNLDVLEIVSQVAGVAGIALAVFLTLFRDVIRKQIFPTLTKKQAFRLLTLVLVLVWSVALSGIGAWIWVSLADSGPPVAGESHEDSKDDVPSITSSADHRAALVGDWLVHSEGNLPETARRELEKIPETNETTNDMESVIGDLVSSFKGLVEATSASGSFRLRINEDSTYQLSEKSGLFQGSEYEQLGSSGSWTFNPADRLLTLIPVGGGRGFEIKITTINKDHLIGEDFGGRTCEFTRQP